MSDVTNMRLRIGIDLRKWLERSAAKNNRSVHAEIISYIEERKQREERNEAEEDSRRKLALAEIATREAVMSDIKAVELSMKDALRDEELYPLLHKGGLADEVLSLLNRRIEEITKRRGNLHRDMLDLMEGKPLPDDGPEKSRD